MKRLCYLGILKEGFSAYSSPVLLISRKLTQDKRVGTDFRHLNMGIAKNNLVYPLLKDTFTMLGSSKCEVMSMLDLKDAFHSLRLTESSKSTVEYSHTLVADVTYTRETAYRTKHIPSSMAIIHKCNPKLSVQQKIL